MVEKSLKVSEESWKEAKDFAYAHNCSLQSFVENAIHLAAKEAPKTEHPKPEPPQQQPQSPVEAKKPEEEDTYTELLKELNTT